LDFDSRSGVKQEGLLIQAAEKFEIGQEGRTSGANARCGEVARLISNLCGPTKVVP
jgi:hypothetical protein